MINWSIFDRSFDFCDDLNAMYGVWGGICVRNMDRVISVWLVD